MNLRSHHILTQTEKGRQAWRTQDMPGLSRKLLATLRTAMTVTEVLARLEGFDMADVTQAIVKAATEGWVSVDEPQRAVLVEETEAAAPAPEDALSDLVSRRPPAAEPLPEPEVIPEETPVTPPPVSPRKVSEAAVFARGTEEQELAALVAMGIVAADRPLSPVYADRLAHREARHAARAARQHGDAEHPEENESPAS